MTIVQVILQLNKRIAGNLYEISFDFKPLTICFQWSQRYDKDVHWTNDDIVPIGAQG